MESELFNSENSTNEAFNSDVTFTKSAHEVTRAEREQSDQRIADMIDETKKAIQE